MLNHLIRYHTLAFFINSNTMVYKKHSTMDPRLSVRPYTNSCCKWNISDYSTSYISCSSGYCNWPYLISHLHKLLSRIIYRDIKTQDDCLRFQQDIDAAGRWEADWLMVFHPDKCTKLSLSPPQQKPPKNPNIQK